MKLRKPRPPLWRKLLEVIQEYRYADQLTPREMDRLLDHIGGVEIARRILADELTLVIQGQSSRASEPALQVEHAPKPVLPPAPVAPPPPTTIAITVNRADQSGIPFPDGMDFVLDPQADQAEPSSYDLLKNVAPWFPRKSPSPVSVGAVYGAFKRDGMLQLTFGAVDAIKIQKYGVETFHRVFGSEVETACFLRTVVSCGGTNRFPYLSVQGGRLVFGWDTVTPVFRPGMVVAVYKATP